MEMLSRNGAQYRTKLMDRDQAARFARCLKAHPAFTGVVLEESQRAKHPSRRWLVVYHPRNGERTAAIAQRQEEARLMRAAEQAADYRAVRDGACVRMESPAGETYEVSEHHCTCPDYVERCGPALISCKHMLMVRHGFVPVQESRPVIGAGAHFRRDWPED